MTLFFPWLIRHYSMTILASCTMCTLNGLYLLMVRAHRLYRQPTGVHRKNVYNSIYVYNSIFPSSNANSDGRIGFYAKFYVGNNITGGGSLQNLDRGAAAERKYLKNEIKTHY